MQTSVRLSVHSSVRLSAFCHFGGGVCKCKPLADQQTSVFHYGCWMRPTNMSTVTADVSNVGCGIATVKLGWLLLLLVDAVCGCCSCSCWCCTLICRRYDKSRCVIKFSSRERFNCRKVEQTDGRTDAHHVYTHDLHYSCYDCNAIWMPPLFHLSSHLVS